jgi:monoamine oxidase
MTLTRREFLKVAAAATAGTALPVPRALGYVARRGPQKTVVVVGAGLAGLSAALSLVARGHNVTILEAQLRPGGRVLTARDPFVGDLWAELGAARIPANHKWTVAFARHFALPLAPFWPDDHDEVQLVRGRRILVPAGNDLPLSAYPVSVTGREQGMTLGAISQALYDPLVELAGDVSKPGWPPAPLRKYDAFTSTEYARQQGLSREVDFLLGVGWNNADGADASLLEVVREIAEARANSSRLKIVGGLDALPRAMAASLATRIHYGRVVERVEQDGQGVRVHAAGPGTPEVYTADRAIVAIPFPPLRRVDFEPALSVGKQQAINEMKYEPLARVALQVRDRPWAKTGGPFFAKTDLPSEIWDTAWDQNAGRGVISVYFKKRSALRLERMNPNDRIDFAVAHAEQALPGLRRVVEGGISKVWTEDPWAGGGHAWAGPGQFTTLMPHATRAEGRLHFGGEHTSVWHGWMQGALESGNRCAREVEQAS